MLTQVNQRFPSLRYPREHNLWLAVSPASRNNSYFFPEFFYSPTPSHIQHMQGKLYTYWKLAQILLCWEIFPKVFILLPPYITTSSLSTMRKKTWKLKGLTTFKNQDLMFVNIKFVVVIWYYFVFCILHRQQICHFWYLEIWPF